MSRTVTATLVALHRMTNSPNGNPRWRLVVSNESGLVTRYTKPDSVINHAITPELVGKSLLLTLDHDGRVVDMAILDAIDAKARKALLDSIDKPGDQI